MGTAASKGAIAACARVKCAEKSARMAEECSGGLRRPQGLPSQELRRLRRPTCWHRLPDARIRSTEAEKTLQSPLMALRNGRERSTSSLELLRGPAELQVVHECEKGDK
eukprot:4710270-Pleurochrysis_carterae.AAC.1